MEEDEKYTFSDAMRDAVRNGRQVSKDITESVEGYRMGEKGFGETLIDAMKTGARAGRNFSRQTRQNIRKVMGFPRDNRITRLINTGRGIALATMRQFVENYEDYFFSREEPGSYREYMKKQMLLGRTAARAVILSSRSGRAKELFESRKNEKATGLRGVISRAHSFSKQVLDKITGPIMPTEQIEEQFIQNSRDENQGPELD